MRSFSKIMGYFLLGILIQGGIYYYLDQVYFAPTTNFELVGATEKDTSGKFPEVGDGKKYYSFDHKYMAVVKQDSVKIYTAGKSTAITVDLKGRGISFFEWMPDRDLAIMGLYSDEKRSVWLAQFNPESPDHEVDTEIQDLPRASRLVDAAYSTATNVVYMKVKVDSNAYRIYRTDANYDTRRVYMQASDIGRIAVFYDEDRFFYDNVHTGDVFMFNGTEGGWRVINPPGRYRLVGVDTNKDLYIANVNKEDKVLSISKGRLGVGFEKIYTYDQPTELSQVTIATVKQALTDKANDEKNDKSKKK